MIHFPNDSSVTALAGRLTSTFELAPQPVRSLDRCVLDSFDWLLFEAGLELECSAMGGCVELRLRQLDDQREALTLTLPRRPQRAEDFPPGALRTRLNELLECRALLPHGQRRLRCFRAGLVNGHGKLLARLELTGVSRKRGLYGRIEGLKGYEKAAIRLTKRIRKDFGAEESERDLFAETTAGCVPAPGRYPRWKQPLGIDADERSDVAVRRALRHYSLIMDLNIPGTREGLDPEFLHEFRVGVRRCRTLLRRIPGVLPESRVQAFSKDFAWLSAETSPVRDLDVHVLEFPDYAAALPAEDAQALHPLLDHILAEQRIAQQRLTRVMGGARFQRRWQAWMKLLDAPAPRTPPGPAARRPVQRTARLRIARVARKAYRQGDALTDSSPAEAYHDLRKTLKNLRYLIDTFQEIIPRKHFKSLLGLLKALQDDLGEHQDLEVHSQAMSGYEQVLAEAGALPEHTRLVVDRLAAELMERSILARARVAELYAPLRAMNLHKHPFGR